MSDYRCGFCRQSLATVNVKDRFIYLAVPEQFTIAPASFTGKKLLIPILSLPPDAPAGSTWLCSKADCLLSAFAHWRHKIREVRN
jgi:hypothetical protein